MNKIQFETPENVYVQKIDENGLPYYVPIKKEKV